MFYCGELCDKTAQEHVVCVILGRCLFLRVKVGGVIEYGTELALYFPPFVPMILYNILIVSTC